MYREYDLFERFPDGSTLWRASVLGINGAHLHMKELSQKSRNQFYAIDTVSGKIVRPDLDRVRFDLFASRSITKRIKTPVA